MKDAPAAEPGTYTISPARDRRVRHPGEGGQPLENGSTVDRSPFWDRRLADGDVVLSRAAADKPAGAATTKEA